MRLIDADRLFGFIQKKKAYMEQNYMVFNNYNKGKYDAYYEMLNIIKEQPTIDAEPVVHGHWIEKPYLLGTSNFCSCCGENYGMPHGKFNYCPNCRAKMDEEVKK